MLKDTQDIRIEDYDYPLPDERIAKFPLKERDHSKLLVYNKGDITERRFYELPEILPADGQVGRVEAEALALAPLQTLAREESLGLVERVGRSLLVDQLRAVGVGLRSGPFHLGGACREGGREQHDDAEYAGHFFRVFSLSLQNYE